MKRREWVAFRDVVKNCILLENLLAGHALHEIFVLEFVKCRHVLHVFFRVVNVLGRVVLERLKAVGMLALDDGFRVDVNDVMLKLRFYCK